MNEEGREYFKKIKHATFSNPCGEESTIVDLELTRLKANILNGEVPACLDPSL